MRVGLSVSRTFAALLAARGFADVEAARAFLDPRLADLTPPEAMADREAAADRLAYAVRHRERVVVFGDYDVDGITSCAIVTLAVRALGGEAVPILASRFDGGYGFSEAGLARVLAASPGLVVTCDCGSSDHARLETLRARGIDAVVIDHHLVPAEPLPVRAFLNPHRPECGFPFKHLASCGLALSIAAAVRARLGVAYDLRPLLDLVALGTIADVAPLVGDNRALVRAGLARISSAPRPGLEALSELAGIAAGASIGGEEIAFKFAPRINAPGRLGAPDAALELLLEHDRTRARAIAASLDQACQTRREIERRIFQEALAQIETTGQRDAPSIVVADRGWHAGVVGIVASRLVDRFGVPTVVVALDGEHGPGSVRGPRGARLHDALTASSSALLGFGGHQAAAGVKLSAHGVEHFRACFADACASLAAGAGPAIARARAEVELDPRDEPAAVVADFERLEPCGEGNAAAMVALLDVEVANVRIVKDEHLRLMVRHGDRLLDAFAYGFADRAPPRGARVDLVGALRRDTYRGRGAVELRMAAIEIRPAS